MGAEDQLMEMTRPERIDKTRPDKGNMFLARPGVHMEFIAKCSLDLEDIYTINQDATNYLWGIVSEQYSHLCPDIKAFINNNKLPPKGEWWKMKYVIIVKFIPSEKLFRHSLIPSRLDDKIFARNYQKSNWRFYAMLPNMSYLGSFDRAATKEPLHPEYLPREAVLGVYQPAVYLEFDPRQSQRRVESNASNR